MVLSKSMDVLSPRVVTYILSTIMIVFVPLDGLGSVRHTRQAPPVHVCSPHTASPACSRLFATRGKPRLFRSVRHTLQAPPVQVCSPLVASPACSRLFATHCKPRLFWSVRHTLQAPPVQVCSPHTASPACSGCLAHRRPLGIKGRHVSARGVQRSWRRRT